MTQFGQEKILSRKYEIKKETHNMFVLIEFRVFVIAFNFFLTNAVHTQRSRSGEFP